MKPIIAKKVKKTKNFTTYQIMPNDDADTKNFKEVSAEMRASGDVIPAVGSIYLSPDFFKFGDTIEITISTADSTKGVSRKVSRRVKRKVKHKKPVEKKAPKLCINCLLYETKDCSFNDTEFDPEDSDELCEDYTC